MTPQKQQIKSSMQFLGKIHEVYLPALSSYFNVEKETHLKLELNKKYRFFVAVYAGKTRLVDTVELDRI